MMDTGTVWLVIFLILWPAKANSEYISYVDDIVVTYNKSSNTWECDRLTCPEETFSCTVILRNHPDDPTQLIRQNNCYSATIKMLLDGYWTEEIINWKSINIALDFFTSFPTTALLTYGETKQEIKGRMNVQSWNIWQEAMRHFVENLDNANRQLKNLIYF